MPLPDLIVPQYPNVPDVPGVPALARAGDALNTLSGTIQGNIISSAGTFTGRVSGVLAQSNGLSSVVNVLARGVIDAAGNIAGTLDGSIAGSIVGAVTGDVSGGFFSGLVSGIVSGLMGEPGVLESDGLTVVQQAPPPVWGLYLNGSAILTPDNITAFDFSGEWRISTYPIEGGGFESYNKIAIPSEPRITMSKGGSEADRAAFLTSVRAIVPSLDLYDIVTPQATFSNMNVKHWDYDQRADRGANLIVVELQLEEIRTFATSKLSNTALPAGNQALNTGPVTALPPTPAQLGALGAGVN